jgi:hypothetical protein
MREKSKESPVDYLLQRFLRKHPAFSPNPLGDWRKLAGPQVAEHSQPTSVKNKVLIVTAYDAIWKHHLELNKESLLEKINHGHPEPLIQKIIIKIGEVPAEEPVLNPNYRLLEKIKGKNLRSKKKKKPPQRPLTQEETELLANIGDAELRAIGKRLLRRLPMEGESETE